MKERAVKKSEVIEAICNPDKKEKQGEKCVVMKIRNNGHLLITYYVDDVDVLRIITVVTTSKISKYLK